MKLLRPDHTTLGVRIAVTADGEAQRDTGGGRFSICRTIPHGEPGVSASATPLHNTALTNDRNKLERLCLSKLLDR